MAPQSSIEDHAYHRRQQKLKEVKVQLINVDNESQIAEKRAHEAGMQVQVEYLHNTMRARTLLKLLMGDRKAVNMSETSRDINSTGKRLLVDMQSHFQKFLQVQKLYMETTGILNAEYQGARGAYKKEIMSLARTLGVSLDA
ncbi:hypothetical protein SBOR_10143 [Sclerotinia borealis F-4128]|uniref:Uncharacterized protein n=1 Tax=Sclerotinia borealis (strain F-4128) TaxID=1432307 RepID=W9C195_SCLBF|nr:hypothetical protein SBOR_10143 [Sclerotinia borealis F-4128]